MFATGFDPHRGRAFLDHHELARFRVSHHAFNPAAMQRASIRRKRIQFVQGDFERGKGIRRSWLQDFDVLFMADDESRADKL